MSEETVTFNLELNVEQAASDLRKIEFILFRTVGLLKRFSGSEDLNEALTKIQRLIMTIRLLHRTWNLMMTASGPLGWIMAGLSATATMASMQDFGTAINSYGG